MLVVALQEEDRKKLKTLAAEREDFLKRYTAARNEYDAFLLALARQHAPKTVDANNNYRLDETESFLVIGAGGEWKRT